jgi:hypothetical protein
VLWCLLEKALLVGLGMLGIAISKWHIHWTTSKTVVLLYCSVRFYIVFAEMRKA